MIHVRINRQAKKPRLQHRHLHNTTSKAKQTHTHTQTQNRLTKPTWTRSRSRNMLITATSQALLNPTSTRNQSFTPWAIALSLSFRWIKCRILRHRFIISLINNTSSISSSSNLNSSKVTATCLNRPYTFYLAVAICATTCSKCSNNIHQAHISCDLPPSKWSQWWIQTAALCNFIRLTHRPTSWPLQ